MGYKQISERIRLQIGNCSKFFVNRAFQLQITLVPAVLLLAFAVYVNILNGAQPDHLTRDVAATAGVHPLTGFISSMGILLWAATASVCAFSAFILRNAKPRDTYLFLAYASLLCTYLLFDDFFMIHERLGRMYLGINDKIITLFIGIAVYVFFRRFKSVIAQTNYGILVLAMMFLVCSVVIDRIPRSWGWMEFGGWEFLIEDAPKWLGIACWCSYFAETAYRFIVDTARYQSQQQ